MRRVPAVLVLTACTGKVSTTEDSGGDDVCAALFDSTTTPGLATSVPYAVCPNGGTPEDLVPKSAVREANGPDCTICTTTSVTGEFTLENPCSVDVETSACLLWGYEFLRPDGIGESATIDCFPDTALPGTILAAGDRQTIGFAFGDLVEGVYTLTFEPASSHPPLVTRFCVDLP